mmetsp:Transcript_34063/g.102676  ORF Transcript_34063/g.102676 Transcript_34063/m.102676 type:complete len:110 (+) Transcript_34063:333-662(+)
MQPLFILLQSAIFPPPFYCFVFRVGFLMPKLGLIDYVYIGISTFVSADYGQLPSLPPEISGTKGNSHTTDLLELGALSNFWYEGSTPLHTKILVPITVSIGSGTSKYNA